jgi:hypothetical protein
MRLEWSDAERGRELHERVERFFAEGSTMKELDVEEERSSWGWLFVVLAGIVALLLGTDSVRGSGTWIIEVDRNTRRVSSRPGFPGWSRRSISHSLEGVLGVALRPGTLRDRWKTRGQTDEAAARLVLVLDGGGELPLTSGWLRATSERLVALHERGRRELEQALETAPHSADEPER